MRALTSSEIIKLGKHALEDKERFIAKVVGSLAKRVGISPPSFEYEPQREAGEFIWYEESIGIGSEGFRKIANAIRENDAAAVGKYIAALNNYIAHEFKHYEEYMKMGETKMFRRIRFERKVYDEHAFYDYFERPNEKAAYEAGDSFGDATAKAIFRGEETNAAPLIRNLARQAEISL